MLINKIVKMKNNKYKIVIDAEIIETYDNVILENNLLYKKVLDKELYKKVLSDTNYYDIYNRVVKYILKRKRSEKEINDYLNKHEISSKNKVKIINKLKDIGLLNDIEFCRSYINDKLYLSKVGINKIKSELLSQNIPEEIINKELNNIDNELLNDRLENLIIKKIKANTKYSNALLKQKILNDMINLGYSREEIINILKNNITDDAEILEKEFNKIYNNLSKKYSGYDLKNRIKQKLIMKGFNIDEINILIQKNTED